MSRLARTLSLALALTGAGACQGGELVVTGIGGDPWYGDASWNIANGDFNANGWVDGGDVSRYAAAFGTANSRVQGPLLIDLPIDGTIVGGADANTDDLTDGADILQWQRSLGNNVGLPSWNLGSFPDLEPNKRLFGHIVLVGDVTGDYFLDGAELLAWQRQSNMTTATTPAAAIPEPGAALLALCALACVVARVRR